VELVAIWGVVVVGLGAVGFVAVRARLRRLCAGVDEAWGRLDGALKTRHDLVPRLVATVGAHAGEQRDAMTAVTSARVAALRVEEPGHRAVVEDTFATALARLVAIADDHPVLGSDPGFLALRGDLDDAEERLAAARQQVNDRVTSYRAALTGLPGGLLAGPLGLTDRPTFDADQGSSWMPATEVSA
jgi:LemA protein